MNLFCNCFSCSTKNDTGLGGEGYGIGGQEKVGIPCVKQEILDLPATSSCTLGSSPVVVICDRQAGWATSVPLNHREGRLVLDLEALGSQGQSTAQCPS